MAEALKRSSSSARAEYLSCCLAAVAGGWEGRGSATPGLVTGTAQGLAGLVGPGLGLGSGLGLGMVIVSVLVMLLLDFETSILHSERSLVHLTRSKLDLDKVDFG